MPKPTSSQKQVIRPFPGGKSAAPPPQPGAPSKRKANASTVSNDIAFTIAALVIAFGATMGATTYTNLERKRIVNMVREINMEIQSPNVFVRAIGNTIVLEGFALSQEEKRRAIALAVAYSKTSPVLNIYRPPTEVLDFVEINKPLRGQASVR